MVDIRTVDILYLHGPHRPERKEHMERHLLEKGLTADCHVGVSDQGDRSGVLGMIAIMRKRLEGEFKPFILLEDNCTPTEWFRYEFPLPEDADALYLGLSAYGLNYEQNIGDLQRVNSNQSTDSLILYDWKTCCPTTPSCSFRSDGLKTVSRALKRLSKARNQEPMT